MSAAAYGFLGTIATTIGVLSSAFLATKYILQPRFEEMIRRVLSGELVIRDKKIQTLEEAVRKVDADNRITNASVQRVEDTVREQAHLMRDVAAATQRISVAVARIEGALGVRITPTIPPQDAP